jgi:hypothetical protein
LGRFPQDQNEKFFLRSYNALQDWREAAQLNQ